MRENGGRPGLFDSAYLMTRYSSEFAMTDIPAPVRHVVFPLVAAIGRRLGRADRFAGAPEPVAADASRPARLAGAVAGA